MRTGRQIFFFYLKIACVAVFSLGIGCCAYSCGVPDRQVTRVTRQVKAELPLGTSHKRVLAYLTQHHIKNGGYEVCQTIVEPPTDVYPCQGKGLIQIFYPRVPDMWPWPYTGHIEVALYFDEQGNLRHYECWGTEEEAYL